MYKSQISALPNIILNHHEVVLQYGNHGVAFIYTFPSLIISSFNMSLNDSPGICSDDRPHARLRGDLEYQESRSLPAHSFPPMRILRYTFHKETAFKTSPRYQHEVQEAVSHVTARKTFAVIYLPKTPRHPTTSMMASASTCAGSSKFSDRNTIRSSPSSNFANVFETKRRLVSSIRVLGGSTSQPLVPADPIEFNFQDSGHQQPFPLKLQDAQ